MVRQLSTGFRVVGGDGGVQSAVEADDYPINFEGVEGGEGRREEIEAAGEVLHEGTAEDSTQDPRGGWDRGCPQPAFLRDDGRTAQLSAFQFRGKEIP